MPLSKDKSAAAPGNHSTNRKKLLRIVHSSLFSKAFRELK
jgi:hypothetical protein